MLVPYFLNTSYHDIKYMGDVIEAGCIGFLIGTPLDKNLVEVEKPDRHVELGLKAPVRIRKPRKKRADKLIEVAAQDKNSAALQSDNAADANAAKQSMEHESSAVADSTLSTSENAEEMS